MRLLRSKAWLVGLVLIMLGALALRLPDLGNRPFHGDEAVHAVKFQDLWKHGSYEYDANEYHGPTIYYAALPAMFLLGRQDFASTLEADYRLPIALIGAAMVLLYIPLAKGLGRGAVLWAALFTAISPAFVFYSRYFIQEVPLACFTLGLIASGWRYLLDRRPGWLVGAGIATGGMIASKETAIVSFFAMLMSALLVHLLARRAVPVQQADLSSDPTGAPVGEPNRGPIERNHLLLFLFIALFTAIFFVSGHFHNLRAVIDYFRAYTPWLGRAHATDLHRHPWHYYLQLLLWHHPAGHPVWSEGAILVLALLGTLVRLARPEKSSTLLVNSSVPFESPALVRFLIFYTLILTIVYCLVPYKTPWCLLSFLNGMMLLAGVAASHLMRSLPGIPLKALAGVGLLVVLAHLTYLSYLTSFVYEGDDANPYVYAAPAPELQALVTRVQDLGNSYPAHNQMVIKVISKDSYIWPLPWYLRRFPNVGYYAGEIPDDPKAPLVIASHELQDALNAKLDPTHVMTGFYLLRPGVFLETWVSMDLWKNYLEERKKARLKAGIKDDE